MLRGWLTAILLILSAPSFAQDVFDRMGARYSVDPAALRAIADIESQSHPWTLNVNGEGFYLRSKREAMQLLAALRTRPWILKLTDAGGEKRRYAYASQMEAERALAAHQGARNSKIRKLNVESTDIGLMQINWYWHGKNVPSLERLFDVTYNVAYSAFYLQKLLARHGDLETAIGFYHSSDPERQKMYVARWRKAYKRVLASR